MLELEGGLDASALVQESPPHVDLADEPDIEADKVESEVEHEIGKDLLGKRSSILDSLKNRVVSVKT